MPSGEVAQTDLSRAPRAWLDGFARLTHDQAPCPGLRYDEWPRVHAAMLAFLERHGEAAYRLGWTTVELFGVHVQVGAARLDCCGALMVSGGAPVLTVTADAIAFPRTTYRRVPYPMPAATVPVWSFKP